MHNFWLCAFLSSFTHLFIHFMFIIEVQSMKIYWNTPHPLRQAKNQVDQFRCMRWTDIGVGTPKFYHACRECCLLWWPLIKLQNMGQCNTQSPNQVINASFCFHYPVLSDLELNRHFLFKALRSFRHFFWKILLGFFEADGQFLFAFCIS